MTRLAFFCSLAFSIFHHNDVISPNRENSKQNKKDINGNDGTKAGSRGWNLFTPSRVSLITPLPSFTHIPSKTCSSYRTEFGESSLCWVCDGIRPIPETLLKVHTHPQRLAERIKRKLSSLSRMPDSHVESHSTLRPSLNIKPFIPTSSTKDSGALSCGSGKLDNTHDEWVQRKEHGGVDPSGCG